MPVARRSVALPPLVDPEARAAAVQLFDLQVWLWGRDVLHRGGNGLVRHGFVRQPPPPQIEATSLYRLRLPRGRRVTLRGFGLFVSDPRWGGLFLERFVFEPRWTAARDLPDNAWHRPQLPDLCVPRDEARRRRVRRLIELAVQWMARYEDWAWEHLGAAHRRRATAAWRDLGKPVVPAGTLAEAWRSWHAALRLDPAPRDPQTGRDEATARPGLIRARSRATRAAGCRRAAARRSRPRPRGVPSARRGS